MFEPRKILFVCQGNIIRSPLAENLFRHHAEALGFPETFRVDSAGTSAWHTGEPPDSRMRETAANFGVMYSGRARQVRASDLDDFDLILAMDRANYRDLQAMARSDGQKDKIRLMREFDPEADSPKDVPDPYYGGPEGFVKAYRIVDRSVRGLLQALEK